MESPVKLHFAEDFWTDSPVHVSKLSDKEFEMRKEFLKQVIEKHAEDYRLGRREDWTRPDHNKFWNDEVTKQFMDVLEKRFRCSLPLPEPIDLTNFEDKDLLAIFSKMHSRSFSRSLRLCNDIHMFLNKNLTKFHIWLRNTDITSKREINITSKGEHVCTERLHTRNGDVYPLTPINDPFSMLPFTFTHSCYGLNYESFWHVFEQMKWPFLHLQIALCRNSEIDLAPWMRGLDEICFNDTYGEEDCSHALLEDWTIVKKLKPKMLCFDAKCSTIDSPKELLDSAPRIYISCLPHNWDVVRIVQEWRSEGWNQKAKVIEGWSSEQAEVIAKNLADCFSFQIRDFNLYFVPSTDHFYLVVKLGQHHNLVQMFLNVQFLSDLVPFQHEFIHRCYPIDYSGYNGDIDAVIDPLAFCSVLQHF